MLVEGSILGWSGRFIDAQTHPFFADCGAKKCYFGLQRYWYYCTAIQGTHAGGRLLLFCLFDIILLYRPALLCQRYCRDNERRSTMFPRGGQKRERD